MRRNVIAWLSQQFTDATHAVMLTHNIDFLFVQSVVMPRLRWAGNPRVTIFADANCAARSYSDQHAVLDGLGTRYRVVPVDLGSMRRFHPKALLLSNRQRAICAVGSGNLTHGGMNANHEVWTFGASDGQAAGLLAGLLDYIRMLVGLLPLAEPLRDSIDSAFDEEQAWVANLPPASGLATSPSDRPIFDQITDFATGEILSISVLTPYFDPDGAALAEIRRRFGVPVTAWFQPGREGLSSVAAAALPSGIALQTIDCLEERRPSFIHAKVFAFHRPHDVVLAAGSANCSRAGLLAKGNWGNAEVMVVDTIALDAWSEFFAEVVHSGAQPKLPEHVPSNESELESPRLRILAARHEGNRLDVAFRSAEPLSDLAVETEDGVWSATGFVATKCLAVFPMLRSPRSIVLTGTTVAGARLTSAQAWVDDEASLAAPASLRRISQRLQEVETIGGDAAGEFRAVLELLRDYLRDPDASRRRMHRSGDSHGPPAPYDPAAVFSEKFGNAVGASRHEAESSHSRKGVLAIIEALFAIDPGEIDHTPPDPEANGDDPDPVSEEKKLISRQKVTPEAKVAEQLRRALKNVEMALLEPTFVTSRRPRLLGADIALAAILLVKGLTDGHIDVESFRETTRSLWGELFFGAESNGIGSINRRLQGLEGDERTEFIADFASPKLSAALTIWFLTEWRAGDPNGLSFWVSATQLHHRYPWLFGSAPPDVVARELQSQALSLLPPNEHASVVAAWVNLVRSGESLRMLSEALTLIPHLDLVRRVTAQCVSAGELLWQANALAFPAQAYRRESGVHAEVRLIGETTVRKFRGDHLVPVRELLEKNVIELPTLASEQLQRFIAAITAIGDHAL